MLWMRAFWPRDSDLVQIVVTVPIALMLTAFSFEEFAVRLRLITAPSGIPLS